VDLNLNLPFKALGRARASGDLDGFVKILLMRKTDEVLSSYDWSSLCLI
jgi:dihydrolipoamide dehydrogenase